MRTIKEVDRADGKTTTFLSCCGGLPATEASDNPLDYNFSWSGRDVLLALDNDVKFYLDGKVEEVLGRELMGYRIDGVQN